LIKLHEFGKIELGLLEDLDLSNHAGILKWEDFRAALLLNLFTNFFFNEGLDELFKGRLLDLGEHDLHHLLSDKFLVGSLGVASGFNLSRGLVSESNSEHSDDVTIGGLSLNESLNKGVPFLDHGACLISGNIHTVEVSVAIKSLDFIALELNLSPGIGLWVAISKGGGEDTTSQTVSRVEKTCRFVTWGQADLSFLESWGEDVVPLLLGERMVAIQKMIS